MGNGRSEQLYELADLVHAVARRLPAPSNLEPGPCTPIEISVMRHVGRNPGVSARAAANACGLPSSNFARVLKGLVAKGLLERRTDPQDARKVHLHSTDLAMKNCVRMRDAWSSALNGVGLDGEAIATVVNALHCIETHLSGAATADDVVTTERPLQPNQPKRRPTDGG